jgi:hypothetical protein
MQESFGVLILTQIKKEKDINSKFNKLKLISQVCELRLLPYEGQHKE